MNFLQEFLFYICNKQIQMATNFYIGCRDYFGKDTTPDDLFNDKLIPLLKSMELSQILNLKKLHLL